MPIMGTILEWLPPQPIEKPTALCYLKAYLQHIRKEIRELPMENTKAASIHMLQGQPKEAEVLI